MSVRNPVTALAGGAMLLLAFAIGLASAPALALRPVEEGGGAGKPQNSGTAAPATGTKARRPERPAGSHSGDDEFTPSERIEADSAVSFPVDI